MTRAQTISCWVLALVMVAAGANHFLSPEPYVRMIPAWLPAPDALVLVSGLAEIAGGLGLMLRKTRWLAAWGLIALFIAVFPANLNMAIHHLTLGGRALPAWALWARLPLQLVLIAWAWSIARNAARSNAAA
jgi:uncharacterized membrane protein